MGSAAGVGMKRIGLCVVLATVLAGCAVGPRYQTVKRYVEPPGVRACVEGCERQRQACGDACARRYQACREQVLPEARERHAERMKQYEAALEAYRLQLERYRLELMLGWGHPYWSLWGGYPPPPPPPAPVPPKLETEVEKLSRERCDRDCGCESAYDACFIACGGEIRFEERCIAHCGPAQ